MFPPIDPSKMDPKLIGELTRLIQELPSDRIFFMQTLMQKAMTGEDVAREMADFEATLPPSFREKIARLMYRMNGVEVDAPSTTTLPGSVRDARLTVLQAVKDGSLSLDDAIKALFPNG